MEEVMKCNHCGYIAPAEELEEREESGCYESDYGVYSEFDSHTYYDNVVIGCPVCGSEDYEIGYLCESCNKFITYLSDVDECLCDECLALKGFNEYE